MRRTQRLVSLVASLLVSVAAAPVQARMVAGWDFSQYLSDGILSIDGATAATTLGANFSNILPETIPNGPFALGPPAATFGRLYYDGQFGSTTVEIVFDGTEEFVPGAGSLQSNLDAPTASGDSIYAFSSTASGVSNGTLEILQLSGQQFANDLSGLIQINGPLSLVFSADLTSVPETGTDWAVSFAGQTLQDSTTVEIEVSPDGTSYTAAGSATLTTLDQPFFVSLEPGPSDRIFVRFNFGPAPGVRPAIDNVAITIDAPEPSAALQALAAFVATFGVARRRRGRA